MTYLQHCGFSKNVFEYKKWNTKTSNKLFANAWKLHPTGSLSLSLSLSFFSELYCYVLWKCNIFRIKREEQITANGWNAQRLWNIILIWTKCSSGNPLKNSITDEELKLNGIQKNVNNRKKEDENNKWIYTYHSLKNSMQNMFSFFTYFYGDVQRLISTSSEMFHYSLSCDGRLYFAVGIKKCLNHLSYRQPIYRSRYGKWLRRFIQQTIHTAT